MLSGKFSNWWDRFMLWLTVVKILIKHAKKINLELKQEKSSSDEDTPGILTKEEISEVVLDNLLEAIPEIVDVFHKRKRR
tara:strand:+ start:1371 stop:1610 length:240 start_codon:yes stop_codon:yes gene_type:complete